ncbi:hypothetical protein ABMA27_002950, partial [Loxostege sticticalis]
MFNSNLFLLHQSHELDVHVARARAKKSNLNARSEADAFALSETKFIKRYRLSKSLAIQLIEELKPHLEPARSRSDALTVETKVLIALAFYATGSYQTVVGDSRTHCVSQPSVSKAVREVTLALNKPDVMNKHLGFPFHRHEREQVKRDFYRAFRMPGVLGCIDGTHVAIVCPPRNEERFYNRKGYHSLNVLIMCDSQLNIMCVDASYPGSTHDSVVWANHTLKTYTDNLHRVRGENIYFLGDSGYPLRPTMMTPILNPASSAESHYNEVHIATRNVVERCIGVLKARFRCLLVDRKLHYSPATAAKIVNACSVLHNIAHRANVPYEPLTGEEARRERRLTSG